MIDTPEEARRKKILARATPDLLDIPQQSTGHVFNKYSQLRALEKRQEQLPYLSASTGFAISLLGCFLASALPFWFGLIAVLISALSLTMRSKSLDSAPATSGIERNVELLANIARLKPALIGSAKFACAYVIGVVLVSEVTQLVGGTSDQL